MTAIRCYLGASHTRGSTQSSVSFAWFLTELPGSCSTSASVPQPVNSPPLPPPEFQHELGFLPSARPGGPASPSFAKEFEAIDRENITMVVANMSLFIARLPG